MSDQNSSKMSIPQAAVIVLCIIGAGAAVLCAYALFRHFYEPERPAYDHENQIGEGGLTQAQYMRQVRLKNQEDLQHTYGHLSHGQSRPKPVAQSSVSSYY